MATLLGSTSPGTGTSEWTGDNNGNAIGGALTLPSGGPWDITRVGAYFGGKGAAATSKIVLFNTSGTVLAQPSATFEATGRTFPDNGDAYEQDLSAPYQVAGGTTVIVAFVTDPLDDRLWQDKTSGTQYYHTDTGAWPSSIAWITQTPGPPGVWLYYEASNAVPTAPTLNSPISGALVTSTTPTLNFTPHDPDADAHTKYTYQVDNDSDFSSPVESIEVVGSLTDNVAVNRVVVATLSRGTTYYWQVKTSDAVGYGPYSTTGSFKVASLPTATVTTPGAGHTAKVYYDAGTNTTPRFWVYWTFNDADGHAQTSASIKVYDEAGTTLLHTHNHTGAVANAKLTAYAPTEGTKYQISVTPTCSQPLTGIESTKNICRVRWARASYFYSLGLTPTGWDTPVVAATKGSTSEVVVEYAATANGTAEPTTWYASFSSVPVNTYVWHRVTLFAWGSATPTGPSVESVVLKYTSATLTADSWTLVGGTSSIDESEEFYGTQSLKIYQDNVAVRYAYQVVTVQPNTDYILSGRMRGTGVPSGLIGVYSADRITQIALSGSIASDVGWVQVATPVFNSGGASQLSVVCRTANGGGTGTTWFDALKLEASTIVTPWSPGFISGGVAIDASGLQVDASSSGILRLKGSAGGTRDIVSLGANGLVFGGDTELYSDTTNVLRTPDAFRVEGGLQLGTSTAALNSTGMMFGADVSLARTAANVLTLAAGDRLDNDAVGILIRKTTTLAIATATWTKVTAYTNTDRAGFGMTWNPYGGSEMRADVAGLYLIQCHAFFAANATGGRIIGIMRDNAATPTIAPSNEYAVGFAPTALSQYIQITRLVVAAANDTFAVGVYQNSGGNLDVSSVILSATRIGA